LDIQNTVAGKTKKEQKVFKKLAAPMLIILIVYFIGAIVKAYSNQEVSYFTLLTHILT
jgi:hypothetical protein